MDWEVKLVITVLIISLSVFTFWILAFTGVFEEFMYVSTVNGDDISTYKLSCSEIDLNKPLDNLQRLSGHKIKFEGKFIRTITQHSNKTIMLVKADNLTSYPYIAVAYPTQVDYKEGDELEIFGQYDSRLTDNGETVPFIKAAYIERI